MMAVKHLDPYRDRDLSRKLADRIRSLSRKKIRIMEVCGTHTVSIFRNGIRSLLPETISLLSGPGCPVCVTSQKEIDYLVALAGMDPVILATFGDLLRVPGTGSSLEKERAKGKDVRIVYSASDAVEIAGENPDKKLVFAGVGFETTAPTVAASILSAGKAGLGNFLVYSAHKRVPPALAALMEVESAGIDGFLLPGHVSVIIGTDAYAPFFEKYRIPCVISGFEPVDILRSILMLVEQIEAGDSRLGNTYGRVVSPEGNKKAGEIIEKVFEISDADWRGIGLISESGLNIRESFSAFDARKAFSIEVPETGAPQGCACGEILTGLKTPPDCALFGRACTPADPVGPCMVSSEGTCAAYYQYQS